MPIGNWEEMFAESRARGQPSVALNLSIDGTAVTSEQRLSGWTRGGLASVNLQPDSPCKPDELRSRERLFYKQKPLRPHHHRRLGERGARCESRPKF